MTSSTSRSLRRAPAAVLAACALALLSVACSSDDDAATTTTATTAPAGPTSTTTAAAEVEQLPTPVQVLDVDGSEYTFDISPSPAEGIVPGWTMVRFHNVGVEPHQIMFARLKDGVDLAELAAAGAGDSSGAAAIAYVDMIGGVSYIDGGNDLTALVNLPEGTVMAMCYVPDAEGVAHALMGMSTLLPVAAPADGAPAPTATGLDPAEGGEASREVVGTIEMAADGYHVPDDLRPGWYHVINTDDEDPALGLHELSLLRLGGPLADEDVEGLIADLAANIVPDVPLEAVGGLGAVSAGFEGYLYLDLEPGDYLAVDFMPDPGDPRPHMLDGYHGRFTVAPRG